MERYQKVVICARTNNENKNARGQWLLTNSIIKILKDLKKNKQTESVKKIKENVIITFSFNFVVKMSV